MHCSVIGRFILSPGINTVSGAMLNIHIFFFPFLLILGGVSRDAIEKGSVEMIENVRRQRQTKHGKKQRKDATRHK